ncbi:MAG TPA: D-amino acid dehydrogenase [Geminicoccaceae bacterium]|nr:D-amino acid dehydrogenase [Geminicoccaceae bacterium]
MRVVVLGAGIVGVTAAYQLAKDGHEVVVIDRQPLAANETSWGNAGMIAPGHAYSWASPKAPMMLLRSLARNDTALRLRPRADPRMWAWCLRFLRECTTARGRANTERKVRLCLYSQRLLDQTVAETGVEYDRNQQGALYLYRDREALQGGVAKMRVLQDNGLTLEPAETERCIELEPALEPARDRLAGGIFCPSDESGDCPKFANGLVEVCRSMGVDFRFETTIRRLVASGDRVERVATDRGDVTGDCYVMSLGSYSPIVARQVGVGLPIYPVKGYSVTIPIDGRNGPPRMSGVDEHNLVAWTRMGDRLRLTATAEISGYDTGHRPEDFHHMLATARDLFPDGGDYGRPHYWAGLRPMTPGGTPILGRGPHRHLIYNTGQGHMGWTMAHGSARITADLVAGRTPEIGLDGMTLH